MLLIFLCSLTAAFKIKSDAITVLKTSKLNYSCNEGLLQKYGWKACKSAPQNNNKQYNYQYRYVPAVGQVVPMPQIQKNTGKSLPIHKDTFSIELTTENLILRSAVDRCIERAFYLDDVERAHNLKSLSFLFVHVKHLTIPLSYDVDQSYVLRISRHGNSTLVASTIWGALYGLQTFSQLVHLSESKKYFAIWETYIYDSPEYAYRGSLIDTSRHYLALSYIKKHIDAMESVKLNILHWHIVDDESFPYVSQKFKNLHRIGAYDARRQVYTSKDIREIVEYANIRGINVIPEFDTPGHTLSWYGSPAGYLDCTNFGHSGTLDPSLNVTYEVIKELVLEAKPLFNNNLIHIGGDEVSGLCWFGTPRVLEYAQSMGLNTTAKLQAHFTRRLLDELKSNFDSFIAWEEVFTDSDIIDENVIIQVWRWWGNGTALKAVDKGLRVIMSNQYYYDQSTADWSWEYVYSTNPRAGIPTGKQHLVIGAEFCQWGEFVSHANFIQDTWVRGAVVAERFWSPQSSEIDYANVLARFDEHHCRLSRMKLLSTPLRTSFRCL